MTYVTPPSDSDYSDRAEGSAAGSYQRSTVAFPYSSLRDAEAIAQELHDKWGGSATLDQLAGGMGTGARGGTFRVKVGTARTFKVVSPVKKSEIKLTSLGHRLLDPQTRASARVDAFLGVSLFARLVDAYKGTVLPSTTGLEQKIADLGVSPKQTAKARTAFLRSAEQAGFFKHGSDRLIQPNVSHAQESPSGPSPADARSGNGPGAGSPEELPLPLLELWQTLLRDGSSWSPEKTQEFVEAARSLYTLLVKHS